MKKTLATLAAAAFLLTGCIPIIEEETTLHTKGSPVKTHAFGADKEHIYLFTDFGTYRFPVNPKDKEELALYQIIKDGRINLTRPDEFQKCPIRLFGDRRGNNIYSVSVTVSGQELHFPEWKNEKFTSKRNTENGREHFLSVDLYSGISPMTRDGRIINNQGVPYYYYPHRDNPNPKEASIKLTEEQKAALTYRPLAEPFTTCKQYWTIGKTITEIGWLHEFKIM